MNHESYTYSIYWSDCSTPNTRCDTHTIWKKHVSRHQDSTEQINGKIAGQDFETIEPIAYEKGIK